MCCAFFFRFRFLTFCHWNRSGDVSVVKDTHPIGSGERHDILVLVFTTRLLPVVVDIEEDNEEDDVGGIVTDNTFSLSLCIVSLVPTKSHS